MNNTFRKSIIALVIFGVLLSSLIPQTGFAQQPQPINPGNIVNRLEGRCFPAFWSLSCILKGVSYVVYGGFVIVGWFVGIAGNVFNFALGVSINNAYYTSANVSPIIAGWAFSRDIVNIFFIFALLFIAIATILGIESYGAKALLARLIIIALLINFSLLATQAVIYVTNALAYQLYSTLPAGSTSYLLNTSDANFRKDATGALMKGLLDQKIFNSNPNTLKVGPVAQNNENAVNINLTVLVTLVAGIFILLFAAFIFIVGAFFFAARMAVLFLLMVLAPFGFVFLILPSTKGYAQKWWTTLQSQAIFAPAFIFFLIITVRMTEQSGLLTNIANNIKTRGGSVTELLFLVIMQNLIIFLMLGGGLIIAKQLGVYGADGAMKMATGAGRAFRGYVGKTLPSRAIGSTARRVERGEGRVAKTLKKIPGVAEIIGAAAHLDEGEIKRYQRQYGNYNTTILETIARTGSNSSKRAAAAEVLKKRTKKEREEREEEEIFQNGSSWDKARAYAGRSRRQREEAEAEAEEARAEAAGEGGGGAGAGGGTGAGPGGGAGPRSGGSGPRAGGNSGPSSAGGGSGNGGNARRSRARSAEAPFNFASNWQTGRGRSARPTAGFADETEPRTWNNHVYEAANDRLKNNEDARARVSRMFKDAGYSPEEAANLIRQGYMTPPPR